MKLSELKQIIREIIEEIDLEEVALTEKKNLYDPDQEMDINKRGKKWAKKVSMGKAKQKIKQEGLMRNRRTLVSKKEGSIYAFKRGIAKSQRRNERGIEKYGQVGFANRRLKNMNHDGSYVNSLVGGKSRERKKG